MNTWLMLAANDYSRHASRYLQGTGTNSTLILFVIGFIVTFWILLVNWDKLLKLLVRDEHGTQSLFQELSQAHELSRSERSELQHVVKHQNLNEPALVFVDPRYIDKTVPSRKNPAALQAVRKRLFGE